MRSAAASLVALAALVAGCGGGSSVAEPASEPAPPPKVETRPLSVYFLREGKVGAVKRVVASTPRVGTAALEELLAGPTAEDRIAGLTTAVPAGTELERLSIEDGVATAGFSAELDRAAQAQVVYTLTQFPSVERVRFGDGEPVARLDYEALTPQILVESPLPGDTVVSPITIIGTANTFEATFMVEVVGEGVTSPETFVTATSGSGTRGTFDDEVAFEAERSTAGELVVYELSAEDGSRINEVRIPLNLSP